MDPGDCDEIPPLLCSGAPSPLDAICHAPVFVEATQYQLASAAGPLTIVSKAAAARGTILTRGSCYIGPNCVLRGDIASVTLNNTVFLDDGCILRPPVRIASKMEAVPMEIGCCVYVGKHVVCEATCIGSYSVIESETVIGELSVVGNGTWIRKGSVVPPSTTLEGFCVYEGNPVRRVARLNEESHALYVREWLVRKLQTIVIG